MSAKLQLESLLTPNEGASDIVLPERKLRESAPIPGKERTAFAHWVREFAGVETESRFCGMLVRSAQDAMIVCDNSLQILFHNVAFLKLFDYREGSFENFSLLDFLPSKDRNDAQAAFEQLAYGSATAMKIEANLIAKDDEAMRVSGRVSRTRGRDGEFFFYIVIRRVLKEAEPEQSSSMLLDNLPLMMWETNANLEITSMHGQLWRKFLKSESVIGSCLGKTTCDLTPGFLRYVDFTELEEGRPVTAFIEWNGDTLDLTMQPVLDENQNMIGTVGYISVPEKVDNIEDVEEYIVTRKVVNPVTPVNPRPISDRAFGESEAVAMAS